MNQALTAFLSKLARDYILIAKLLIAVALTCLATFTYLSGVFDRMENLTLDQRFKMRGRQFSYPKLILVEVAEDSIQAVGRWPWDREWHATIVKALKDFGARAVAFDVLFSEPAREQTDTLFAKMIEDAGNVYLPVAFSETEGDEGKGIVRSIPSISSGIAGEGHITITPDSDGILRRIKLRIRHEDKDYYQLGFLLALDFFRVDPSTVRFKPMKVEVPIPGNPPLEIPLTQEGDFVLNWPGKWKDSFRHVSFIDVIVSYAQWLKNEETRIDVDMFEDALCIVGVSATGLFDIRATPVEPAYPAMGVNGTVLNSLVEKKFLRPLSDKANIAILWAMSALIFLIMQKTSYIKTMTLMLVLTASYLIVSYGLFIYGSVIITIVYPLFLILTTYLALTAYHQIVISIEKNRLMRLAVTDPLTGLYNIAHFKRLLQAELLSTQLRAKKDISIVMVDGDHFKGVNDTYGHPAGDTVLRGISEVLKGTCRALDVAARYGGEEFIIMLPGATLEAAVKVAEKMRAGIESHRFLTAHGAPNHVVTASFGVVAHKLTEDMDAFLKRVDEALYFAKDSGRNRVCTL